MTQGAKVLYGGHHFNTLDFVSNKTKTNNDSNFNLKLVRNNVQC